MAMALWNNMVRAYTIAPYVLMEGAQKNRKRATDTTGRSEMENGQTDWEGSTAVQ